MSKEIDDILNKIESSGISVYELSNKTGIPKSRLYSWTQGRAKPKHEDVQKLTLFFNNDNKTFQEKLLEHKNGVEKRVTIYVLDHAH